MNELDIYLATKSKWYKIKAFGCAVFTVCFILVALFFLFKYLIVTVIYIIEFLIGLF